MQFWNIGKINRDICKSVLVGKTSSDADFFVKCCWVRQKRLLMCHIMS